MDFWSILEPKLAQKSIKIKIKRSLHEKQQPSQTIYFYNVSEDFASSRKKWWQILIFFEAQVGSKIEEQSSKHRSNHWSKQIPHFWLILGRFWVYFWWIFGRFLLDFLFACCLVGLLANCLADLSQARWRNGPKGS